MPAAARFLVTLLMLCLAAGASLAQAPADTGAPTPPQVQSANGIDYVSGGAGEEARAAIAALQKQFSLRVVFSETTGAYVVVDEVRIRRGSSDLVVIPAAGPMLLLKLLPGDYVIEASYAGKVERRKVQLRRERVSLHWRWPASGGASAPR
jgi:hypothetical protein